MKEEGIEIKCIRIFHVKGVIYAITPANLGPEGLGKQIWKAKSGQALYLVGDTSYGCPSDVPRNIADVFWETLTTEELKSL